MKLRIVEHTTRMFARDGVKAVRMDDIAAEMGISKRTIYEIFGDKDTLITECLDHFTDMVKKENEEIASKTDNIIAEYLSMLEGLDRRMDATCKIMDDMRKFYPHIYEQYLRNHACEATNDIQRKLQQGIEQGYLIPSLDIKLALSVLGHSMYGAIKTEQLAPSNVSQRDAFKFFITHFIRGISTQKGIELIDKKLNNE